jgi:hypothetical protein
VVPGVVQRENGLCLGAVCLGSDADQQHAFAHADAHNATGTGTNRASLAAERHGQYAGINPEFPFWPLNHVYHTRFHPERWGRLANRCGGEWLVSSDLQRENRLCLGAIHSYGHSQPDPYANSNPHADADTNASSGEHSAYPERPEYPSRQQPIL